MLLIIMLVASIIVSLFEFQKLNRNVYGLIDDNYKIIEASKAMINALEQADSATLLLVINQEKERRNILISSDSSFLAGFEIAKNIVTKPTDKKLIEQIEIAYKSYQNKWQEHEIDIDKQANIEWYRNDIHLSFINTKNAVTDLMSIQQTSLYNEASSLKAKSYRAIMPGIITLISAVFFIVLLIFFIFKYFVSPIKNLTNAVRNYHPQDKYLRSNLKSEDELKKLESAINDLLDRLKFNKNN